MGERRSVAAPVCTTPHLKNMRGKTYTAAKALIDKKKTYALEDALVLLSQFPKRNFAESVELHAHLGIDPKKGDQQIRSTLAFPYSAAKPKTIAAFVTEQEQKEAKEAGADIVGSEELVDELVRTNKINFDIAVATPAMMPKLARAAKILGPKGLMPNPKTDTVSANIKKMIEELKRGKIAYKNDDTGNIHLAVGKTTMTQDQLKENILLALDTLRRSKPASAKGTFLQSVYLTTTMGPAIKLSIA